MRRGPFWSAPVPALAGIVARAPFPLYGLAADWTGDRGPDSAGVTNGQVTYVGLRHGSPASNGSKLVVKTFLGIEGQAHLALIHADQHLDADHERRAADVVDPDELLRRQEGRWRPVTFPVEGRHQVFWLRDEGERWAAWARVATVRVVVAATRWDHGDGDGDRVRLAVVDPAGYGPVSGSGSTTSR